MRRDGLLRRRDFQLVFVSVLLSSLGDYLALIALTLHVFDTTGSGWAISGLLLAGLIPQIVFAPLAGLLVDRRETVRVLTFASLGMAAAAAGLAFTGPLAAIYALALVLGVGAAVAQPGLFALIPKVAGEEQITQANAYLSAARWGGAALGPVLAGALSEVLGKEGALLADAGSFLIIALAMPLLSVRRPPAPREEGEPPDRARDGFVVLGRDPVLRLAVGVLTAVVLFAVIDNVAEAPFAKDDLGAGDAGYGWLVGLWTFGMVLGSTLIGRRLPQHRLASVLFVSSALGGAAVTIAAGVSTLPVALAMFVVGGMCNGTGNVAYQSLIHLRVPEHLRGRGFAAFYAIVNTAQVSAMAAGGALYELLGGRGSLLIAGSGALLAGLAGMGLLATVPASRRAAPVTPAMVEPSG